MFLVFKIVFCEIKFKAHDFVETKTMFNLLNLPYENKILN